MQIEHGSLANCEVTVCDDGFDETADQVWHPFLHEGLQDVRVLLYNTGVLVSGAKLASTRMSTQAFSHGFTSATFSNQCGSGR